MITLEKAKQALTAAEEKARELGDTVTITIVDEHGSVIATSRMDGALTVSPKFAYSKAFTAATLRTPTHVIAQYATEGKPYFGISSLFGGKMCILAGGVPVTEGGKVVGGIGVGGSMDVSHDLICAEEAGKLLGS